MPSSRYQQPLWLLLFSILFGRVSSLSTTWVYQSVLQVGDNGVSGLRLDLSKVPRPHHNVVDISLCLRFEPSMYQRDDQPQRRVRPFEINLGKRKGVFVLGLRWPASFFVFGWPESYDSMRYCLSAWVGLGCVRARSALTFII